jgi:hypothetical protein
MQRHLHLTLSLCLLVFIGFLTSCSRSPTKFESKDAEKGVVMIFAIGKEGGGTGSGFYIGDNTIITNNHVVDNADIDFLIVGRKHGENSIELQDATVQWTDRELDMAILKVPDISSEPLTLADAPITKGDKAYAIGFPSSAEQSRTAGDQEPSAADKQFFDLLVVDKKRGIIQNQESEVVQILDPTVSSGGIRKTTIRKWDPNYSKSLEVIEHDVNIGNGNSGGPLFDEAGRVIGINTQGFALDLHNNVKCSSRITELLKVLDTQNISAQVSSTSVQNILFSGMGRIMWFLIIVILTLVTYIAVTFRNKPKSESLTQYAGRVSGYTRFHRPTARESHRIPSDGPRWEGGEVVNGSSFPQEPEPRPQARYWLLKNEPTCPHQVELRISEQLLKENDFNLVIGRKKGLAHLIIDNSSISKSHAILSYRNGNFAVIDQNSANGTKINRTVLNPGERTRINSGDRLTLGEVTVSFIKG